VIEAAHLVTEFLDQIDQRADKKFKGHHHQAFLDWYIEAEFGDVKWSFTDDVNDGGIDAVVWRPDETPSVFMIQSKFTRHVAKGKLAAKAYKDFKKVVEAFKYEDDPFDEFLSGVRTDLKRIYRKAEEALSREENWHQKKKSFRIISTYMNRASAEFDLIPHENFIDAVGILKLYNYYRQAQTPRARELRLRLDDKLSYRDPGRGIDSYIFNARVHDFRKYLERNEVSRLVARNIRYDLGGKIGKNIRKTYDEKPRDFWYFHNGLTLICDEFEEKNGEAIITAPSVINGAQTLYSISGSSTKNSPALVATRVIVRNIKKADSIEDDKWIQAVIESVNSQNKVQPFDLRSNDPQQILLQSEFRGLKLYYERKRGEWREVRNDPRYRNFERLSLKRFGQILTAASDTNGNGVLRVKKGTFAVFDSENYKKLFPNRKIVSKRFARMYLTYRLYDLLRTRGYASTHEFYKQRHAFWNCLWLLQSGVMPGIDFSGSSPNAIKRAFDHLIGSHSAGRAARNTLRKLTMHAWAVWRSARRQNPDLWTANNFFKSSFGIRRLRRQTSPKFRSSLKLLGKQITSYR
jgi:AIPR protein